MADPIITFNELTGAAENSGCGPATAVTGTAAVHTSGASSTTLTFTDTPDLSTVSVDDVIFLQNNTYNWLFGQAAWNRITAVDNVAKTVTIETAITIAVADAADYGIGGKAQNLLQGNYSYVKGSLTSWSVMPGWIIEFETDQTVDGSLLTGQHSSITRSSKPVIWRSADGTIKTITNTHDGNSILLMTSKNHRFENLKFDNSAATKVNAVGLLSNTQDDTHVFKNCIFGDATNTLNFGIFCDTGAQSYAAWTLINCEIAHCISDGIYYDGIVTSLQLHGCSVHDNGGHGIHLNKYLSLEVCDTLIYNNGGDGLFIASGWGSIYVHGALTVNRCTIHGNTGDGIDFGGTAGDQRRSAIINCNITGNGGYGIRDTNSPTDPESGSAAIADYNNFGTGSTSNTSGTISDGAVGPNSLTVDPGYTDTATADFSVGDLVKGLGFPTLGVGQSGTTSHVDIGAAQREEAGGGGSPRLINGGLIS